ncbi:hypothetical protein HYX19_02775 [Candidatus Woesearchaeota archaeon]|nr:hypothetical protein [Candidatus Woesearchaeota archaeon]
MKAKRFLTSIVTAGLLAFTGNSLEAKLSFERINDKITLKYEGKCTYIDEFDLHTYQDYISFIIGKKILYLPKNSNDSQKVIINNCKTELNVTTGVNGDTIIRNGYSYDLDFIKSGDAIINKLGNFSILKGNNWVYVGRIINGILKESPPEANISYSLYSGEWLSISNRTFQVYINTDKVPYMMDPLGNLIDISLHTGYNTLGWSIYNTSGIHIGKDEEEHYSFEDAMFARPSKYGESNFAYFFSGNYLRDDDIKDFPEYFAIENNFGSGEIFKIEREEGGLPILKLTPYKISADGIIGDGREIVKMPDDSRRPKPILKLFFGALFKLEDKELLAQGGWRISKKRLLKETEFLYRDLETNKNKN